MARPGGLGRGLGALIPSGDSAAMPAAGLLELPTESIRPNPHQPREIFDEQALATLAESIREVGVLQPVLVRLSGDGYELIAGERRWRAARRVGLQTIPAVVRVADDALALQQAIVENVQRENLDPLEEAAAYQQLIEDFQLTHDDVARRIGKSRAAVSNCLRILQLPPTVQRYIHDGSLKRGHAIALLGTPDRAFQEQLARRAVSDDLSVRSVEDAVRARGGEPVAERVARAGRKLRPPGLPELENLLSDHLDTRVSVVMSDADRRGRVIVEFADLEDLERIYRKMTNGSTAPTSAD
ncbi:MAG TPA: ParB/RepB/Spo0J family partition protein [Acidimicrobiia bacterium]|nr:ParB/RepB/Spo0J family partition protein [Acidimicrobiia bacterium]